MKESAFPQKVATTMLVACSCVSMVMSQPKKPQEPLKEGERFNVRATYTYAATGMQGELISPNIYYDRSDYNVAGYAIVHYDGDTMYLNFFNKADKPIKQEVYDAHDYLLNGAEPNMDGPQKYFRDGHLYCTEIIKNKTMRASIWFNPDSTKDRMYVFRDNNLLVQNQFYPTGQIKYSTRYTAAGAIHQAFAPDGTKSEFTPPQFPGGKEALERAFSLHFKCYMNYHRRKFSVVVSVDTLGRATYLLHEKNKNPAISWSDEHMPLWTPATIGGEKVSFTFADSLLYAPWHYIQNGDTIPVNTDYKFTSFEGIRWRVSNLWKPTSNVNAKNIAVVSRDKDTIDMEVYAVSRKDSFSLPSYVHNATQRVVMQNDMPLHDGYCCTYKDGQKAYEEFYHKDTLLRATHFWTNGLPEYIITTFRDDKKTCWDTLLAFYPTGELKWEEVSVPSKGKTIITYYDKERNEAKATMPICPGGAKALQQYLQTHYDPHETFPERSWAELSGYIDMFFAIDETGRIVDVVYGECSITIKPDPKHKAIAIFPHERFLLYENAIRYMKQDTRLWTPGTIAGQPAKLRVKIRVPFKFKK